MPRFFYTENNHKQYQPPDNFWRRFLKHRKKKQAQAELDSFIKLRNPYRHTTEKPTKRRLLALPIGLGLIFVGWLAIMIYLPYFRISKTSFAGLKTIKQAKIETFINSELNQHQYLPFANYFLISTNNLERKLKDSFPLRSIVITKIFPNELKIIVEEKISSIVYDSGKFYYLLDENGSVMEILGPVDVQSYVNQYIATSTASSTAISTTTVAIHTPEYQKIITNFGDHPILFDKLAPEKIELGQTVLSKDIISATINASEEVEKRGIGKLKYFIMDSQTSGLRVITDKKFEILLSFFSPAAEQFANAETILRSNHPNEYIDVRFGERVFWK